jgi:hypothetical protein
VIGAGTLVALVPVIMFSNRFFSLVGLVIALSSAACAANSAQADTQTGTCEAACGHYLECRNAATADNQSACVTKCNAMGKTESELAQYEQTDCATAIQLIEGSSNTGSATPSGDTQPKSDQCKGCVSDGSSCIWASQSDWGQGPYSGAVMDCDPSCCQ